MTTKDRIQSRLNRSKRYVFTRDDFRDIAGYDQRGIIASKEFELHMGASLVASKTTNTK